MIKKVIKKEKDNGFITVTTYEYQSISDVIDFIESNEQKERFKEKNGGYSSIEGSYVFTKTHGFSEAYELLKSGWEEGTKRLKDKLETKLKSVSTKQKTIYDVAGFQCSVPRYLQGVPTNMINKKTVSQKNKVITINKNISYGAFVSADKIIEECAKVLELINNLESNGCRVNLNIIVGTIDTNRYHDYADYVKICVKQASQKLNLKQVAFPVMHPSMLRRIFFALMERYEEGYNFANSYGRPLDSIKDFPKEIFRTNEYYLPRFTEEEKITDIEKYKVR